MSTLTFPFVISDVTSRTIICSVVLALALCCSAQAVTADYEQQFAELLGAYVHDGRVDYTELKKNAEQLETCRRAFAKVTAREFEGWIVPQRLAYLVNYYNLTVLTIVVEDYPLKSIRKAGGWFSGDPFEWRVVELFSHRISLNTLLGNYMLRDYADPGVLLAISQGARGSAPLRSEPYTSERFYAQIQDQARVFLQKSPNRIDTKEKRMYLPPIFRSHTKAFVRKAGSVEAYVREISPEEWSLRDATGRWSISFNRFDWRLNDTTPQQK